MKKFNYQITIEAPGREIADLLMKLICKENTEVITEAKSENPSPENSTEKKTEFSEENKGKENVLKGISDFEKVIHIIKCCVQDETLIDRMATTLGFNNNLKTQTQP